MKLQIAIRFACVTLVVSWCWIVDTCNQIYRKLWKQCVAGWFLRLNSQTCSFILSETLQFHTYAAMCE